MEPGKTARHRIQGCHHSADRMRDHQSSAQSSAPKRHKHLQTPAPPPTSVCHHACCLRMSTPQHHERRKLSRYHLPRVAHPWPLRALWAELLKSTCTEHKGGLQPGRNLDLKQETSGVGTRTEARHCFLPLRFFSCPCCDVPCRPTTVAVEMLMASFDSGMHACASSLSVGSTCGWHSFRNC